MKTIIVGAGGHGKVVMDVVQKAGFTVLAFLDDNKKRQKTLIHDLPVLGGIDLLDKFSETLPMAVVLAIGDNSARQGLFDKIKPLGFNLVKAVHPDAIVHETAKIDEGTVVMPGAIVNIDASIGKNCIINTGAVIEHDCLIGNHVHIAPGSTLTGGVTVGERTLIGAGSVILPSIKIGKGVKIAAGSVVIDDMPDEVTAAGVPARIVKK